MEMNVENILSTMRLIVLANRNSISTTGPFHCCRDERKGHHQRSGKIIADIVNVGDVSRGHDKHMTTVPGLLLFTWEHSRLDVAIRNNLRRQFTTQDAAKHTRYFWYAHYFARCRFRDRCRSRKAVWVLAMNVVRHSGSLLDVNLWKAGSYSADRMNHWLSEASTHDLAFLNHADW